MEEPDGERAEYHRPHLSPQWSRCFVAVFFIFSLSLNFVLQPTHGLFLGKRKH